MLILDLKALEFINISGIPSIADQTIITLLSSLNQLLSLRASSCVHLTNSILEYILNNETQLKVLELNRTPLITDDKIQECRTKKHPNLRIIRVTNIIWNTKNLGLKVPLMPKDYVKPLLKGKTVKKNDDKNPVNQLKRILEETKPKKINDLKF